MKEPKIKVILYAAKNRKKINLLDLSRKIKQTPADTCDLLDARRVAYGKCRIDLFNALDLSNDERTIYNTWALKNDL